jgi:hypothetical protein
MKKEKKNEECDEKANLNKKNEGIFRLVYQEERGK